MKSGVKIVFWDWLGTLVSSHFCVKFYLQQIRTEAGIASADLDDMKNLSPEEIIKLKNILAKKGELWIPYAWSLVNSFSQKRVRQVIVSNGSYDSIAQKISNSPFRDFDMILTSSKFDPKPSPQMVQYALGKFGIKPEQAVFIGDAPVDMETARVSGIGFYQVDGSLKSYQKIAEIFKFCQ